MKRSKLSGLAITLAIWLGCSQCSTYVKYRYGISRPEPETRGSLISFLEKHGFPQNDQYWFPDPQTFRSAMNDSLFRHHVLSYMIFDRKGRLLERDSAACQWSGAGPLRHLSPDAEYTVTNTPVLKTIIGKAVPLCLESHGATDTTGIDFTFVAIWGKYLGKYNSRLFSLKEFIDSNHLTRIRIMWLNADWQEAWSGIDQESLKIEPGPGWK